MWQVTFEYPCLERADEIYRRICSNFEKFDRHWPDADRAKNFQALQYVLNTEEDLFWLDFRLWTVETEDGERVRSLYTYDERMHTYVDLNPSEWVENRFDFSTPLDAMDLLEDFAERASEFKSFYQIKTA